MAPKRSKQIEPTPLGQKITLYRKKKGLTMLQLSEAMGVTQSYISFLESGERSPSRKLIHKLVDFFYPQGNPALLDEWLILAGFSPESPQPVPVNPDPSAAFETRLSQNPQDLKTQFAYIRSLIKAGAHERAKAQIQQCFQLFDGAVEVQSLVGSLELAKGNFDNAITAQETALGFFRQIQAAEVTPGGLGLTDLLLSLGVSCFLKGYHQLGLFHQARLAGQKKPAKTAQQAASQSFSAAREHFLQALAADPEDIYIWDEYARVCFNLAHLADLVQPVPPGQSGPNQTLWQETIAAYDRVLLHHDNRVIGSEALLETAVFLGHAHSKSGQFAKAAELLALIQAIRPEYWLAHYARACQLNLEAAHVQATNPPHAQALLDQALHHLAHALQRDLSGTQARQEALVDPDLQWLRTRKKNAFAHLLRQKDQET